MKKIFFLAWFCFFLAHIRAQEIQIPLPIGNLVPDSVVEITMLLPGTAEPKRITVSVINGLAILEGDIILGPIEELQNQVSERGVAVDGTQIRWPSGIIPFTIEPGFSEQYLTMLHRAIEYINGSSHLWLCPRSNQSNWIRFTPSNQCSSFVGQIGGAQTVNLQDPFQNDNFGCWFPQIIHEVAHAAGLWHEQSREDRNSFVVINWQNVQTGQAHNFNQHIADGTDIGPYDFASVMHYGPTAFSANGQPTITAIGGQTFGNAPEYSVGDVAAINWMYPGKNCSSQHVLSADFGAQLGSIQRPLHYETWGSITSTASLPAVSQVIYDADVSITFLPGFQVKSGAIFRAVLDGCGGPVQSMVSPEDDEWLNGDEKQHVHMNHQADKVAAIQSLESRVPISIAPNPFSSSAAITYTLTESHRIDLQIVNVTGVPIAHPVRQEIQEAGTYQYRFDAGNLPDGIYFAILKKDGITQSERISLTR